MAEITQIRVMLVDDHAVVRSGLAAFLMAFDNLELVAEAGGGEEAVRLCEEARPDVVLMDLVMPGMDGVEATRQIGAIRSNTKVIVLTSFTEDEKVFPAIQAGAAGYLLKSVSGDELVRAVKAVHNGEPVLDPVIAKKVLNYFKLPEKVPGSGEETEHLSDRELDIIRLAAKGLTNKEIADRLHLSYRTVEGHMRDVFNKLGVGSRTEAVLHGLKKGWFTLEELA